ncbi:MAG: tRNA (N6-threonylcarbamoyladenosine(37)-N6)-methyltransferase TrmO [Desulfovibrionaceae bacterium]
MNQDTDATLHPIGIVRSVLKDRALAPKQNTEGAPDAWVEVAPAYAEALVGLAPGQKIILITWLHEADRTVQQVHPRGDLTRPIRGVFSTRSPDRPNPLGLHEVTLVGMDGMRLHVEPLEAIDGTPVVDIKSL